MKTNTKLLSSYKKYVYKTAKKHFKNNIKTKEKNIS